MVRISSLFGGVVLLASWANGLKILMTNDDGFGSSHLRETYKQLKEAGHDVVIVAPADEQSGAGGRVDFAERLKLTKKTENGLLEADADVIGHEETDDHIWWYDGTPATCIFVAVDWVLPKVWPEHCKAAIEAKDAEGKKLEVPCKPDLVITGPNFGSNFGPYVWTVSGTAGAAYTATYLGIPAMAFSAAKNRGATYRGIEKMTAKEEEEFKVRLKEEKEYTEDELKKKIKEENKERDVKKRQTQRAAWLTTRFVQQFINSTTSPETRTPLLPLGHGLNINFPVMEDGVDLQALEIVQTRMTGGAEISTAHFVAEKGWLKREKRNIVVDGLNECVSGPRGLPSEIKASAEGKVTVSIYTVEYDAPEGLVRDGIAKSLGVMSLNAPRGGLPVVGELR